jgi:hypothetical protein
MRAILGRSKFVRTSLRFPQVLLPQILVALAVAWPTASWAVALPRGAQPLNTIPVAFGGPPPPPPPSNAPPVINVFFATSSPNNLWVFEGSVTDENPSTVFIQFGGILQGASVEANADGSFWYATELPPETSGGVTAQAFDEWGATSEVAECFVR